MQSSKFKIDSVNLVSSGFLGSCWGGAYHYLEPWLGCEHNCHYCYARDRLAVTNSLKNPPSHVDAQCCLTFEQGILNYKDIKEVVKALNENKVQILKLSRYTDFFTPSMVKKGHSFSVLKAICEETDVKRIIITTKGVGDDASLTFMESKENRDKFSYNAAILPESEMILIPKENRSTNRDKIEAASRLQRAGVKTTIHLDPLAFSLLDSDEEWESFLQTLANHDLKRLMFSYMILDANIERQLKKNLPTGDFQKLRNLFELNKQFDYSYVDLPVSYIKTHLRQEHMDKLSSWLNSYGFDFVLCSLKSLKNGTSAKDSKCTPCDGSFYA